jgi:hypothetical protein
MVAALPTVFGRGAFWDVDPRLILATAGTETGFGTDGSCCISRNNPWNYGGGCNECFSFGSFADAASEIARHLRQFHFNAGRMTISAIGDVWCPLDNHNCNVEWPTNTSGFYGPSSPAYPHGLSGNLNDLTYGGGCCGDCNHDSGVALPEVVVGIGIGLGERSILDCPAADSSKDGFVFINDLLVNVISASDSCYSP